MTGSLLLHLIFRRCPDPLDRFNVHGFHFEFVGADDDRDIFYDTISRNDFRMMFVIYGLDTSSDCDTSSKLDFLRFIWLNLNA